MLLDLAPLRQYRDYRLLFTGQIVSYLGSMISYVAVPYQVYELTKSSVMVGLLGTVQLVPVLVFGLLGGAYADRLDRRKLLLGAEMLLCLGVFAMFLNASLAQPKLWVVFTLTAFIQSVNAFHRPAMEAMTQNLVQPKDYPSVAALGTLKSSTAAVVGPALGGVLIASFGIRMGFLIDFCTFFVAMTAIFFIRSSGISAATVGRDDAPWASIGESLRFAFARPQLVGTYLVDIVAMTFAFPTALFPAMAEQWGGARAAGILFSSMAVGSLLIAIGSGWTSRVRHHGRAVVIAALLWAVAMVAVGFSPNLWTAAFFLALAGAADSVSGIFRMVIWNQTIPNDRRGKLAGLEMISYMTGPLLGNMRAGWMAGIGGVAFSIYAGGILCVAGVAATAAALPKFWSYQGPERKEESL